MSELEGSPGRAIADFNLGFSERAFSAAGAAVLSAILINPLDVAKTRLQAQAAGVQYDGVCKACFGTNMMLPDLKHPPSCIQTMMNGVPACPQNSSRYSSGRFFKTLERHKCQPSIGCTNCWNLLAVLRHFP